MVGVHQSRFPISSRTCTVSGDTSQMPKPVSEVPAVRAWREEVVIPTCDVGQPNRNPMFLEKRVYQGSNGAVYRYP